MLDPRPSHRSPARPRRTRIPVALVPPLLVAILFAMIAIASLFRSS